MTTQDDPNNPILNLTPNTVMMDNQKVIRLVLTRETLEILCSDCDKTLPLPQIADVFLHRDEKNVGAGLFSMGSLIIWWFIASVVYTIGSSLPGPGAGVSTLVALVCLAIPCFFYFADKANGGLNVTLLVEMRDGGKILLKSTEKEETLGLIALDIKAQICGANC